MAADIVWPLGVTMWRNGASARTRSSAFSKAGASLAANPFSSIAPAASVFTLAPDSGSPLSRSRVTAARIVLIRGCGRAAPSGSRFTVEEGTLALDAPAVARERAVVAHDPVAGNGDRDRVRRASLPDGAHGFRRADALRDLRVRHRGAGRDLAQRLPDALLKGGAAHIERQVEPERRRFDEANYLGDPLLEVLVAADQGRPGKAVLELAHQRLGLVAQQNGAHAFAGGGDQDRAERAFADGGADRRGAASGAEAGGRHSQHLLGLGVGAAARMDARALDRFLHAWALRQGLAHAPGAVRRRVGFGGDPGNRPEHAVEMKAAHSGGSGERVQVRHLLGRLDQAAG